MFKAQAFNFTFLFPLCIILFTRVFLRFQEYNHVKTLQWYVHTLHLTIIILYVIKKILKLGWQVHYVLHHTNDPSLFNITKHKNSFCCWCDLTSLCTSNQVFAYEIIMIEKYATIFSARVIKFYSLGFTI